VWDAGGRAVSGRAGPGARAGGAAHPAVAAAIPRVRFAAQSIVGATAGWA